MKEAKEKKSEEKMVARQIQNRRLELVRSATPAERSAERMRIIALINERSEQEKRRLRDLQQQAAMVNQHWLPAYSRRRLQWLIGHVETNNQGEIFIELLD